MVDRPILFSTPMVQALMGGRKTQTRRLLKDRLGPAASLAQAEEMNRFAVRDRLWVREKWAAGACADTLAPGMLHPGFWIRDNGGLWYAADGAGPKHPITPQGKPRPAFFMPRWASRITLVVSDVRIQRLQEISEADARAEGIRLMRGGGGVFVGREGPGSMVTPWPSATDAFSDLWKVLHGVGSWAANPWVVALTFTTHHCNIDQLRADE